MKKQDLNESTRIQRAIKLDDVPPEKWSTMAARTVIGTLFFLSGGAMVTLTLLAYYRERDLSTVLLLSGMALMMVGATTWSSQIITGSLKALLGPFKAYRRAWKDDA